MPAAVPLLISAGLSAGASAVASHQSTVASKRVAREKLAAQGKIQREGQIADKEQMESERLAERKKSKLTAATGQAVRNRQLSQKNIKAKPFGSFADVTRSVLDEGNNA